MTINRSKRDAWIVMIYASAWGGLRRHVIVVLGTKKEVHVFELRKTRFEQVGRADTGSTYARIQELYRAPEGVSEAWLRTYVQSLPARGWHPRKAVMFKISHKRFRESLDFGWSNDREVNRRYRWWCFSCFHLACDLAHEAGISIALIELLFFARAGADQVVDLRSTAPLKAPGS